MPTQPLTRIQTLQEYLSADSSPEAVLVCGWATTGFMAELLWALSRGSAALPPGSEIVFGAACDAPSLLSGAPS